MFKKREKSDHVIIDLGENLSLKRFIELKLFVEKILKQNASFIDINLDGLTLLDSGMIRFLVNLNKILKNRGGKVALFNTGKELQALFKTTNVDKVFTFFASEDELSQYILDENGPEFDYWSISREVLPHLRKVPLKCPVCGNTDVYGYILDPEVRELVWKGGNYLPSYKTIDETKNPDLDFRRTMIAVCPECFTASHRLDDFSVLEGRKERIKSRYSSSQKNLLTRGMTKRKRIAENGAIIPRDYFEFPRTDTSVIASLQLAETCARTISLENNSCDSFILGFYNILIGEYIDSSEEQAYFDRARTWFTQMLEQKECFSTTRLGEGYYYLFMSCVRLDRKKEARQMLDEYVEFEKKVKSPEIKVHLSFWIQRAHDIWKHIISEESHNALLQ